MMKKTPTDERPYAERMAAQKPDHSTLGRGKIGVVLSNLGTPDATDYWSMRRYLSQFLSDRRVIDYSPFFWQPLLQLIILTKRPFSSGEAYRSIWNNERDESPLLTITREQTEAVAKRLEEMYGDRIVVDFAMRYGNPSTKSVIDRLLEQGCGKIVFFPLYPQYSATTTATANDEAFRALMKATWQPPMRTVPSYCDHPLYIEALAQSVERKYAELDKKPDALVVSYHGMPVRYLMQGDPYHCQCQKTTRLVRERLGFAEDEVVITFQSRFGSEEWLQPYTVEEVAKLAEEGKKNIAIMAPAFSSDCVETLEEISEEIRDSFIEAGGQEFTYIPCLNSDESHIAMMVDILKSELSGWAEPKA